MFPNFHNNSYVLTNIIGLRFENPKRGDVVVFKSPPDPEKAFIKRIIGLPGDTIQIRDGKVYVNGQLLHESSYLDPTLSTEPGAFIKESQELKIPDDEYFMMGDNRNFSSDSREWGFVSKDKIIGFSMFVYWPINEAKLVKNPLNP